jgi:hypothetical protein
MDNQAVRSMMPGQPVREPRINVYIDGYNFYVPLSTMEKPQYELCWCDFLALSRHIVKRLGDTPERVR